MGTVDVALRFFGTPKGLLTLLLALLTAVAAPGQGVAHVALGLASAVAVAALVEAPLRWRRHRAWEYPSGAILTGWLVAMVLSPQEPWYVIASASAVAILSKYALRLRGANIFNPAALALVVTYYIFDTGQSWWGALADIAPGVAVPVLLATGIFIVDRVNKIPLVLAFLGTYYLLFTATAFLGDPEQVVEAFVAPDLQAVLFFAFFMLSDPPTSPAKYSEQLLCGVIVGAAAYSAFVLVGAVYFLLAGVLAGNVLTTWRRWRRGVRRTVYN